MCFEEGDAQRGWVLKGCSQTPQGNEEDEPESLRLTGSHITTCPHASYPYCRMSVNSGTKKASPPLTVCWTHLGAFHHPLGPKAREVGLPGLGAARASWLSKITPQLILTHRQAHKSRSLLYQGCLSYQILIPLRILFFFFLTNKKKEKIKLFKDKLKS